MFLFFLRSLLCDSPLLYNDLWRVSRAITARHTCTGTGSSSPGLWHLKIDTRLLRPISYFPPLEAPRTVSSASGPFREPADRFIGTLSEHRTLINCPVSDVRQSTFIVQVRNWSGLVNHRNKGSGWAGSFRDVRQRDITHIRIIRR